MGAQYSSRARTQDDGQLHLDAVEELQLRAGAVPGGVYPEGVGAGARLEHQAHRAGIRTGCTVESDHLQRSGRSAVGRFPSPGMLADKELRPASPALGLSHSCRHNRAGAARPAWLTTASARTQRSTKSTLGEHDWVRAAELCSEEAVRHHACCCP